MHHFQENVCRLVLFVLIVGAFGSRALGSGLLAPTDQTLPPLRVTDHLVDVQVRDGIAITRLTQTFRNDTTQRLEGTYIFPLPDQADLTEFQMSFNGKMVKGEVLEAQEAAQIYETIVRQAKDPGLIEFIGRRLLKMRVWPLEPESDTTITVQYQQICKPVSGMNAYHYPLRTRTTTGQAYGTVRFNIELENASALKSIWSPTHAVEIVRKGDHKALIAYEAKGGSLEEDFLLLYDTDDSDLGMSCVAYKPNKDEAGHFVLMLTPKQLWPQEEYQPQDVVFVVDTSGSMAGDKIEQARRAITYCIDSLDERDRFSVVRFSTGFDTLFETPKPASKDNRTQAHEFISGFKASGGTNITDTLLHALCMQVDETDDAGRPFVIVFLTDGRGNREAAEIMASLGEVQGAEGRRIFPFGVGHDVNTKMLDRLADVHHGRVTYVQPGENLELVLGDFFSVISKPVLTGLQLTLPEIQASERFPATLGDLYHGQQLIVAGRYAVDTAGPVKLTAYRGGERVEFIWPNVSFMNTDGADYVPRVWAGRKIAYLIDQIRLHGENEEMVNELIELSIAHGIQTPYTSWLVTPEGRLSFGVAMRGGAGAGGGGRDSRGGAARGAVPAMPQEVRDRASRGGADVMYDLGVDDQAATSGAAVQAESGQKATELARRNAVLREATTADEDRLVSAARPLKINGIWFNRINNVLVDERLTEDTQIVEVAFGSEAYFELVRANPAFRKAFAESKELVLMMSDTVAVLIGEGEGIEKFSDENRKQIGLEVR
jgi:Ca-activated chloride channel family protein